MGPGRGRPAGEGQGQAEHERAEDGERATTGDGHGVGAYGDPPAAPVVAVRGPGPRTRRPRGPPGIGGRRRA